MKAWRVVPAFTAQAGLTPGRHTIARKSLWSKKAAWPRHHATSGTWPICTNCHRRLSCNCVEEEDLYNLCVPFLHEGHANLVDAPTLMGVMMPLLLYTDDLILMCDSAAGLQKHLDTRELLRTTSTYRLVKNINLQSTSAQQRWYCLSINAVMCQTLC